MSAEDKVFVESFLTVAAAFFALGFWIRRRESVARSWPRSSGVIVTSKTVRQRVSRGGEAAAPVIEYQFDYQGHSFKSSHWRFGNYSVGNVASAQTITSRYPVGLPVNVFVNPRQPMRSVLEATPSSLCWVPFGFGILLFLLITLALPIMLRR
jgi:hypothetical protein